MQTKITRIRYSDEIYSVRMVLEYDPESLIEITKEINGMAKIYVSSYVDQVDGNSSGDDVCINKDVAILIIEELKKIFDI